MEIIFSVAICRITVQRNTFIIYYIFHYLSILYFIQVICLYCWFDPCIISYIFYVSIRTCLYIVFTSVNLHFTLPCSLFWYNSSFSCFSNVFLLFNQQFSSFPYILQHLQCLVSFSLSALFFNVLLYYQLHFLWNFIFYFAMFFILIQF